MSHYTWDVPKPRPCVHGRSRCDVCEWIDGWSRESMALRQLNAMTPSEIARRTTAIDIATQRRVRTPDAIFGSGLISWWRAKPKSTWRLAWDYWRAAVRWGWTCHRDWLSED